MFAGRLRRGFRAGLAVGPKIPLCERSIVAALGKGTSKAKCSSTAQVLPIIINAFAALRAGDPSRLIARHLTRMNWDRHPLFMEEVLIRKLAISKHLLLIFILDMRKEFTSTLFGRFKRSNTNGFKHGCTVLRCERQIEVDEGSGH